MAFSSLLLLPALALILLIQGTWLKNTDSHWIRSDSYKRNLKAKVLLHRALIVSLLIGTAVAFMSPFAQLHVLLQGLLVTLLLMIPVLLYLWIVRLKAPAEKPALSLYEKLRQDKDQDFSDSPPRTARDIDTAPITKNRTAITSDDFQTGHLSRPARMSQNSSSIAGKLNRVAATDQSVPPIDMSAIDASTVDVLLTDIDNANVLESSTTKTTKTTKKKLGSQPLANKTLDTHGEEPVYEEAGPMLDETLQFDMTLSMEEQLYNIDNSIEYIDIGVEESANSDDAGAPENADIKHSDDQALNATLKTADTELASHTEKQETMPAVLYGELTKKLSVLQKDKTRLQKLVIAQKALIDSEVLSRRKSQVMAQDAMNILRRVREGERHTRKIARNEQRKRQRLEADNASLAKQLKNALSTRRIKEDSEF